MNTMLVAVGEFVLMVFARLIAVFFVGRVDKHLSSISCVIWNYLCLRIEGPLSYLLWDVLWRELFQIFELKGT